MSITTAAMACHEANRIYCETLGDFSQLPWRDAPAWQRESAIAGARAVALDPDRKAADSHASWLAHKIKDGWVYGEVKDPDASPPTHPCMVPFEDLSPEQQMKDHLFLVVAKLNLGR